MKDERFSPPLNSLAELGTKINLGTGDDPDIAVSNSDILHIVYVRSGITYYKKGTFNGGFEQEIVIGNGVDPRIDVDDYGYPYIVMGSSYAGGNSIKYTKWNGINFNPLITVVSGTLLRKPRIGIDKLRNAIISYEDRSQTQRVRYVKVNPYDEISQIVIIGDDNNGGLSISNDNLYHFTFRSTNIEIIYIKSNEMSEKSSPLSIIPSSSDFSDLDISPLDNSVHAVSTVAAAGGIYYTNNRSGIWNIASKYATNELIGAIADNVNPSISVDINGTVYITFSGSNQIPYYFTIDNSGTVGQITNLDNIPSGGKYTNPNIEDSKNGGAYVIYSSNGTIYLNTIKILGLTCPPLLCKIELI